MYGPAWLNPYPANVYSDFRIAVQREYPDCLDTARTAQVGTRYPSFQKYFYGRKTSLELSVLFRDPVPLISRLLFAFYAPKCSCGSLFGPVNCSFIALPGCFRVISGMAGRILAIRIVSSLCGVVSGMGFLDRKKLTKKFTGCSPAQRKTTLDRINDAASMGNITAPPAS